MSQHPDEIQILDYIEGLLSRKARQRFENHIAECPTCRTCVETMNRTGKSLGNGLKSMADEIDYDAQQAWTQVTRHLPRHLPRGTPPSPTRALLRSLARHAASLAIVLLAVASLAGLLHTLAISSPATKETSPEPSDTPTEVSQSIAMPEPLPSTKPHEVPVSILLLGVDMESAASRQIDMAMLLYLDSEASQALALSLPRDLSVTLPESDSQRLRDILLDTPGEIMKEDLLYAGRAVSFTIGIAVDHVILIRPGAFTASIDAIGGVDVDVPNDISDSRFPNGAGGYDRVFFAQGLQHLDSESALKYVRSRVAPNPGFDRGSRQRQVVLAAFERIARQNLVPELIKEAPALWGMIRNDIETDLSMSDVIDLALNTTTLSHYDIALADLEDCQLTPESAADSPVQAAAPVNVKELIESLLEKME